MCVRCFSTTRLSASRTPLMAVAGVLVIVGVATVVRCNDESREL